MTPRFALLVGLSGLMGLSACSAMMTFTLAGGLNRPEVAFDGGRKACVNELTVYEANDAAAPLWSIEAEGRRCVMLRHVVYGQTPLGFSVLTPAASLRPDGVYEAVGGGSTTHPLSKIPWRGYARFHFRDGQWRSVETVADAP